MSIHLLNQKQFSRIFYYLQDSDLKALGAASPKIQEFVANELKKRDLHTEKLLLPSIKYPTTSGFVVTRKFNIQHISEARLLPIGDEHGNEDCIRDRSALIGFLSRRAPVILLIEGVSPMEKIPNIFQPKYIQFIGATSGKMFSWIKSLPEEPAYKANIHAIGWDDCEKNKRELGGLLYQENQLRYKKALTKEAHELMLRNEATNLSSLLPKELSMPYLWEELVLKKFEAITLQGDQLLDFIQNRENFNRDSVLGFAFMFYFTPLFFERVDKYVTENLEEIQTNQTELLHAYEDFKNKSSFFDKETKQLEQDYQGICHKMNECIELESYNRNVSMANTLQKVDAYRLALGIGEHYVVVIAGSFHLEAKNEKEEHDLIPIYEELRHRKAAILLPNVVATQYHERQPWSLDTGTTS